MYQSLVKEQVDTLYECLDKKSLYHKLFELISSFKKDQIHLDFFLKTFRSLTENLTENVDAFKTISEMYVQSFYKYEKISKLLNSNTIKQIEEKINLLYKNNHNPNQDPNDLEKLEIDIIVENISSWSLKIFKKHMNQEKLRQLVKDNIEETKIAVIEDLIPLYEEIVQASTSECQELISAVDENTRLRYDFDRATEDKLLNSLKLLDDPNKNYHEFLMDFLADKFSPFGLKINRTYNYNEHLQEINKMMSSELRIGLEASKPQQKQVDDKKEIKSRTNISYSSINQLKRIR